MYGMCGTQTLFFFFAMQWRATVEAVDRGQFETRHFVPSLEVVFS